MRQYTTPIVQLRIVGHTVTGEVYVTFADMARNKLLTIENPIVETDGEDTIVEVHLTQEQTGRFAYRTPVSVQVNWVASEQRYATEIETVAWNENLIKEVL